MILRLAMYLLAVAAGSVFSARLFADPWLAWSLALAWAGFLYLIFIPED
jgi:hypothetical protein